MTTRTERIKEAVAYLKGMQIVKFQKDIITAMDADKSTVSQALNGNEKYLTDSFIERFCEAYPDLNPTWLLTGSGSMLKGEEGEEDVKILPNLNYKLVPLLNLDAVGGMTGYPDEVDVATYTVTHIPFVDARSEDICISVTGNSMEPTCPSGSIVQIRQVHDWREYFGYGSVFVLMLKDGRRIIKEVTKSDEDRKNNVLCISHNRSTPPEELPRSMIVAVFKVIKILTDEGF